MIWNRLRTHTENVELFRRSIARGRLSHGYLFAGPPGVGKRYFARLLTQCLFCENHNDEELLACGECPPCKQVQAGTHPDLLTVGCPKGKRVLPVAAIIGEPERRGKEGLCHDLSLRPMSADRRIAIIDDANLMNAESANALLKTLEEPPPRSIIILIATQPETLLPTIRSRCQLVRFAPLATADTTDLLLETGMADDPATAAEVAAMSEGSLDIAAQLLNPGLRDLRKTLFQHLGRRPLNRIESASQLIEALNELGGDSAATRANAVWLVRFVVEYYRAALRWLSLGETADTPPEVLRFCDALDPAIAESHEKVMALIERATDAEGQLNRTVPVPLCLETLFDDLGRIADSRHPVV